MAFSTWIRNWKRSLGRRWVPYQATRRKAVARHFATQLRLEVLEDRWLLSTYVVNTTADSGTGSLRDAINSANATGSTITEINFNIGTKGTNSGVQTISPSTPLPALTATGVLINGYSENQWQGVTSTSPLIELNGASVSSNGGGLGLDGNNNTVSGLIITRFTYGILVGGEGGDVIGGTTAGAGNVLSGNINAGVLLDSDRSGDAVEGSYIGTNVTGTERGGNDDGILVLGNNNTIGGSVLGARNVISGNNAAGVNIDGGTGTLIEGNYIGVDATGTISVYNAQGGIFDGGENNTIGGTSTAARNVISGNTRDGVDDLDNAAEQVFGNYIGTDATGTKAIPNSLAGIEVSSDFGGVTIGGTAAGAGNVISGNLSAGVLIDFANSGIQVQGNYIGTDATGAKALANSLGIQVGGAVGTIGGTSSGARNIISGNTTDGVLLNASFVTVQGNYIGTDVTGTQAIANGIGVYASASNDTISGSVISGNSTDGVFISSNVSGVQVQGNYIGTDVTGAKALGNSIGVYVNNKDNTIGGTTSGARNIISGNTTDGVFLNVSAVSVQGNYIGTDVTGSNAVGNSNGIEVAVSNNLIGDTVAAAGNVISGNTNDGVLIDSNVTGVDVYGNFIGTDVTGAKAVGNHTGVEVAGSNNRIGFASTQIRNIISGNSGDGVLIDAGVSGVAMQGNYIGTNAAGSAALANSIGIAVSGSNNTIGGRNSAALNLISGNSNDGMLLDSGSSGNQVQGNYIGANYAGSAAVANEIGILDGGSGNILGGSASGASNVISGNSNDGVLLDSTVTAETMQGNYIGTDTSGNTALANGTNGVEVKGSGNIIGGNSGANHFTRNFISGNNKGDGVRLDSGASGNQVLGNFIGLAVGGVIGLANSIGIEIGGNSNTIGGTANGVGNVISGNSGDGVLLDSTATGNLLQGSYVGTDHTGRGALANSASGIEIQGVGNTVGAGNVLSGNSADGVRLDSLATGNLVLGSLIGLNLSGAGSNGGNGINILGNGNTVGGTVTAARNIISGNTTDGVRIASGASGNQVLGNFIGTNIGGTAALANSIGVEIQGTGNTLGGASSSRNLISGNANDGVKIDGGGSGNVVLGNYIGVNTYDTAALANSGNGIEVAGNGNTIGASYAVAPNEISGNSNDGVLLDSGSSGNQVLGSYIGTNHSGTAAVANKVGIEDGGSSNTIGGSVLGDKNVISGNTSDGVLLDSTATAETMQGNYIGLNVTAKSILANGSNGIEVQGSNNLIGGNSGSNYYTRNFLSGNNGDGVLIANGATGNQVLGNFIGLDVSGTHAAGNVIGVEIAGNSNILGGTSAGIGNVLSGNSSDGLRLDSSGNNNLVQRNFVGTNYNGTSAVGNGGNGVTIVGNNNTLGGSTAAAGNTIASNSGDGVLVSVGVGNTITSNSIFANTGGGISLSNGGNNNLAAPNLLTATLTGSTLTVTGSFTVPTANVAYVLQFFANPSGDAEGKIYLGSLTVKPTSTGTQSFTFTTTTIVTGTYPLITATLTDNTGNTSDFSSGITVQ